PRTRDLHGAGTCVSRAGDSPRATRVHPPTDGGAADARDIGRTHHRPRTGAAQGQPLPHPPAAQTLIGHRRSTCTQHPTRRTPPTRSGLMVFCPQWEVNYRGSPTPAVESISVVYL